MSELICFPVEQAGTVDIVYVIDLQFDYKIHRALTNGNVSISFLSLLPYSPSRRSLKNTRLLLANFFFRYEKNMAMRHTGSA